MREEVKWFAKICSSASRLEHCWDELWGGTNAVTKLSFPAFFLSNKFISRTWTMDPHGRNRLGGLCSAWKLRTSSNQNPKRRG